MVCFKFCCFSGGTNKYHSVSQLKSNSVQQNHLFLKSLFTFTFDD